MRQEHWVPFAFGNPCEPTAYTEHTQQRSPHVLCCGSLRGSGTLLLAGHTRPSQANPTVNTAAHYSPTQMYSPSRVCPKQQRLL
jgi:hypothetical protein